MCPGAQLSIEKILKRDEQPEKCVLVVGAAVMAFFMDFELMTSFTRDNVWPLKVKVTKQ